MTDKYIVAYIFIFAITITLTVVLEKMLIPRLTEYAKQPIYEDGPRWHISKKGTPTMGGLAFLISITVGLAISAMLLLTDAKSDAARHRFLHL
jgi:UDP-N-acetylmuramyl pentapeptide phosphotransferase/UDP-N-acetylglucosamine-1-phosphate transferase